MARGGIVDVPWWIGVVRWVTLTGAALCAFARNAGIGAAYDDPTVSLRVVGRSADERSCVMPWRDRAFGEQERTAAFRCPAQEAKAATHRPWRGRLHEVGAAGPGVRWAGPLGALGVMTTASGFVLGIRRNFVW
ncbi:hypothetical protein [Streptomyces sp. NPDC002104]